MNDIKKINETKIEDHKFSHKTCKFIKNFKLHICLFKKNKH